MKRFGMALYSNKAILELRRISLLVVIGIFLINVMLASAPLFQARASTSGTDVLNRMVGLEEALEEIYDLGLDCSFNEGITCLDEYNHDSFGGYELVVEGEPMTDTYMYFGDTVTIKNEEYVISGNYLFINGMTINPDANVREYSEVMVYGIVSSTLANDYFFIFVGQFIQNILFMLVVSVLLMAVNYSQKRPLIRYIESVKITIISMLGPALLSAIIGLVLPAFTHVAFFALFSLRMMSIYFGIFKFKNEL